MGNMEGKDGSTEKVRKSEKKAEMKEGKGRYRGRKKRERKERNRKERDAGIGAFCGNFSDSCVYPFPPNPSSLQY